MSLSLFPDEAVPLGAAWIDRFAKANGIRGLVIKGPVLGLQGLRGEHRSSDVDLLVDPARHEDFLALLAEAGWTPQTEGEYTTAAEHHAVTVYHDKWPITFDVHRHFPGFLADPQVVFEAMWVRSTTATVANTGVLTLDPVAHSAVAALHYLRALDSGLAAAKLPDLIKRVPQVLDQAALDELTEFAMATGSAETLAEFLEQVGAPVPAGPSADVAAVDKWELRQSGAPSTEWVMRIFSQPFWKWPAAIWHALWLSDELIDIAWRHDDESRLQARLRRLRRGLRNAPGALKSALGYARTRGAHRKGNR